MKNTWIVIFETVYNDDYVGKRVRDLLSMASATSIHVEKFDENEKVKLTSLYPKGDKE